ncbi:hypothetical protein MRX96_015775 [Rhipicephalus microplus]
MRPKKQGQYVLFAGNYFSAKCTYVWTVEGFVDLGKFTQEEDRTTPADHGMVMMFQPFQACGGHLELAHPQSRPPAMLLIESQQHMWR